VAVQKTVFQDDHLAAIFDGLIGPKFGINVDGQYPYYTSVVREIGAKVCFSRWLPGSHI
jgi:hypothetical protein